MPAEHEGFAPASWLCTCPALTIPKPSGLQALRKPDGRRTAGQAMRMHCSMHDCTQKQCRLLPCVCSCTCLHSSAPAPLQDVRHGHGSRQHFCALHVVTGLPYKARLLPRLELLQAACDGHSEFLLSDFVRLAASSGASCAAARQPPAPCRAAVDPRASAGGRGGPEAWPCFVGGCAEVGLWAARGPLAWRASPRDHCSGRSWRRRSGPRSSRRGRGASVPRGARAVADLQVRASLRAVCRRRLCVGQGADVSLVACCLASLRSVPVHPSSSHGMTRERHVACGSRRQPSGGAACRRRPRWPSMPRC